MAAITLETGAGALSEYYDWFKQAPDGQTLIYHTGDLQFDRDETNGPVKCAPRAQALSALASRVLADAQDGYLVLTQKRLGSSRYEYRATRVRSPFEPAHT
jgi:hypothetical protein